MTILKSFAAGATLGLALVAAAGQALAGGDVVYTGVKTQRGAATAVPVPAPVPIPDVASGYYFRLDAAYAMNSIEKYKEATPRMDLVRQDDGLENFGRFGLGAGYHFRKWLRGDVTFDVRNEVRSKGNGSIQYSGPSDASNHTIAMRDTVYDRFRTKNYTGLVNGYIDLPVNETFTPYVGAGIGLVMHTIDRRQVQRTTACVDAINCDPSANGGVLPYNPAFTGLNSTAAANAGPNRSTQLAWAIMTGFAYKISNSTSLDFGYRMLSLGGTTFTTTWNGSQNPKLTIPDQINQELRVGLRYDIN